MANKSASVIQSGTNNYLTPAESFNVVATDLVTPGVVSSITSTSGVAPTTGSFAVNAQGSPNMSVAVSAGEAYVNATPTGGTAQNIRVKLAASENVTIPANSTGSTRYDYVYIKVDADKLNNPAADGTDVVTLITQRSTTLATDSNGTPANALAIATVTVTNGAVSIANADITDRRVQAGAETSAASVMPGAVVQVVSTNYSAVATGTGTIPNDDTIPQITEGTEFMTQAITPRSAANTLLIEATVYASVSIQERAICALFQDSTANALAAASQYQTTGTGENSIILRHTMTAGTTSSTTFRIRIGGGTASTVTFNGQGGSRKLGGITLSNIRITEIKV